MRNDSQSISPEERLPTRILSKVALLRSEGRRRRLRVQIPTLFTGSVFGLFGLALLVGPWHRVVDVNLSYLGNTCLHVGPFCAALALRPQDRIPIRLLAGFAWCLCIFVICRGVMRAVFVGDFIAQEPVRRLSAFALIPGYTGCLIASAIFLRALFADLFHRASPRRILHLLWLGCGTLYLLAASSYLAIFAISLSLRGPSRIALIVELVLLAVAFCSSASLGCLAFWPGLTLRTHEFLARVGEGISAASGIAEMIGGLPSEKVLSLARASFRCVTLDQLTPEDMEAHTAVGALAVASEGELLHFERRSSPAVLGSVDVFISHSWHDDPELKWEALQAWRARFVEAHGREPSCWFDRICIDQSNIQAQLPSLPVYLAGCKTLLALQGPTFFSRLWCVIELHVFHQMGGSLEDILIVPLQPQPQRQLANSPYSSSASLASPETLELAEEAAMPGLDFDVRRAKAVSEDDTARLLAVIENSGEGIETFNEWIRMVCRVKSSQQALDTSVGRRWAASWHSEQSSARPSDSCETFESARPTSALSSFSAPWQAARMSRAASGESISGSSRWIVTELNPFKAPTRVWPEP